MTLKTRVAKLEETFNIVHEPMPEGLSAMEQYLWLIHHNDTSPRPKKETPDSHMTPVQAYAAMTGDTWLKKAI